MSAETIIPIFDGHNDAVSRYLRPDGEKSDEYDFFARNEGGHLDLPRARDGHFAGGFFAAFAFEPRTPPVEREKFQTEDGYDYPLPDPVGYESANRMALAGIAQLFRLEQESGGQFTITRTMTELAQIMDAWTPVSPIACVVHLEGADPIDEDLNLLEVLYQAGLRSLGIVWSRPNIFGHGVPFRFPSTGDTGAGLTGAGKRLVKRCNELGIMIDLAHITEKGFWDVADLSDAPLVATHSNAYAMTPMARNLTDKQLDAIRETDGMVGVNFGLIFLTADSKRDKDMPLTRIVEHIDYLVERVGVDRVGFGSDFDGTTLADEMTDAAGMPKLIQALRAAGYDDESLRKLAYQNWMRVLRQTWKPEAV